QEIAERFEHTIRERYLKAWLRDDAAGPEGADRVILLYAMSLIYATRDNALGQHIQNNARWWANSLGLSERIVTYYIESSTVPHDAELPAKIDARTGREWLEYSELLCGTLGVKDRAVTDKGLAALRVQPSLRSEAEYEALEEARLLLLEDESLSVTLSLILGELDASLASDDHRVFVQVAAAVEELTEPVPVLESGLGLNTLMQELGAIDRWRARHLEPSRVIDDRCGTEPGTAAAAMARRRAKTAITGLLESIPEQRVRDGLSFFDQSERLLEVGAVRGYGGGATVTISGYYTKDAFENTVAPVLREASTTLSGYALETDDRDRVRRHVKNAIAAYASAYRNELVAYYLGFEFDPGSQVALPFALEGMAQPSSWFADFLTTVTDNASLTLLDDEYHAPLESALETFSPLVKLLAEEDGAIPGLEPYTAIVAGLLPLMKASGAVAPAVSEEDGLDARLTGLGRLALQTLQGTEVDRRAQVTEWLEGARIDYSWHQPFNAPLELIYRYGEYDVEDEVEEAWVEEVLPVVRSVLSAYPFDGAAETDARVVDIEGKLRKQGSEPGELWTRFDRLIGPATQVRGDRIVMLGSIPAPMGMLDTLGDVQNLSEMLWDVDGKRVPLSLRVSPRALPTKEHDGRKASMAYLSSGGSAVYAFNQRPEPQTLELRWWDQGDSVVSLTMNNADGDDAKEFTVEEEGTTFSLYRLLDQGRDCKGKQCRRKPTSTTSLTQAAINKGRRCGRFASRGSAGKTVTWSVAIDDVGAVRRLIRLTFDDDPWAPFAVRDCR
ncbi:MAG: hypothetical protein K0V04_08700, partial [Deltaproteobacteria bacterium]|nr:hypothetical protein [Deltaproteobacteria bacterium]